MDGSMDEWENVVQMILASDDWNLEMMSSSY